MERIHYLFKLILYKLCILIVPRGIYLDERNEFSRHPANRMKLPGMPFGVWAKATPTGLFTCAHVTLLLQFVSRRQAVKTSLRTAGRLHQFSHSPATVLRYPFSFWCSNGA
jgi:hypothetical protein